MRSRILSIVRGNSGYFLKTQSYSSKPIRCDAHMNELPVPCEPWEPAYKKKQNFYNQIFFGGIGWFVFSGIMMVYTDSIYFNWGPPAQPGPPSDAVEECEDDCRAT